MKIVEIITWLIILSMIAVWATYITQIVYKNTSIKLAYIDNHFDKISVHNFTHSLSKNNETALSGYIYKNWSGFVYNTEKTNIENYHNTNCSIYTWKNQIIQEETKILSCQTKFKTEIVSSYDIK